MAWEDRLDEALYWHDLSNDRHNQQLLDEQDAKRAAEARQHAKDIATLQGTVDELKDQLTAERKARARAEQERADAETRFRFEMWSQTENGKQYLADKKQFLIKAAKVKTLLDAVEADAKDFLEQWVVEHGFWPNPAFYGLDNHSQLLKKPFFNAEGKRQKAILEYNNAVDKALKKHLSDCRKEIQEPLDIALADGFWITERKTGLQIIQAVENHSQFSQASGFSPKEVDTNGTPIDLPSDKCHLAEALMKIIGGAITDNETHKIVAES